MMIWLGCKARRPVRRKQGLGARERTLLPHESATPLITKVSTGVVYNVPNGAVLFVDELPDADRQLIVGTQVPLLDLRRRGFREIWPSGCMASGSFCSRSLRTRKTFRRSPRTSWRAWAPICAPRRRRLTRKHSRYFSGGAGLGTCERWSGCWSERRRGCCSSGRLLGRSNRVTSRSRPGLRKGCRVNGVARGRSGTAPSLRSLERPAARTQPPRSSMCRGGRCHGPSTEPSLFRSRPGER